MAENLYYYDTSIWIDIYDERGYNGEVAKKHFEKVIRENSYIIYSETNIAEWKKLGFSDYEINQMLRIAKPNHLKLIHPLKEQIQEAIRLAKQRNIPKADALQAILARDYGAQMISRDLDFERLKDITITKKPEEDLL